MAVEEQAQVERPASEKSSELTPRMGFRCSVPAPFELSPRGENRALPSPRLLPPTPPPFVATLPPPAPTPPPAPKEKDTELLVAAESQTAAEEKAEAKRIAWE